MSHQEKQIKQTKYNLLWYKENIRYTCRIFRNKIHSITHAVNTVKIAPWLYKERYLLKKRKIYVNVYFLVFSLYNLIYVFM